MLDQPNLDRQVQWLLAEGWKEWKVCEHDKFDRIWYKKFPNEPRCQMNEDKPMQASVRLWDFRKYRADAGFGFDICINGETTSNRYVHINSGSISNVETDLNPTLELLFKMWRAANV